MLNIAFSYQHNGSLGLMISLQSWPQSTIGLQPWPQSGFRQLIADGLWAQLSAEEKAIATNGTGRADRVFALLLKSVALPLKQLTMLRMTILGWINTFDGTPTGLKLFAEVYPLLYRGGTVKIKVKRTDQGAVMSGQGGIVSGRLSRWEVHGDGTGICAVGEGQEIINFHVEELLEDITLVELLNPPSWFREMIPAWRGELVEQEHTLSTGTALP